VTGIPDPGRASKAVELVVQGASLVQVDDGGVAFTTSLVIARGTANEHRAVLQLIRNNLADFEEFGGVAFEMRPFGTAGGTQNQTVAVLNEEQATLLMTYLRNSDVVREFKKRLVRDFYTLRRQGQPAPALTGAELFAHAVLEAQAMLAAKDERIAELEPKAEIADRLLDADGDLSVGDTAQALTRAGIKTGRGRLFATLEGKTWIYRSRGDGRYRVCQRAIDAGWMSVLPQSHYHPKTGELVLDPPQPRVTPKGLQRLLSDLSGTP
jgi:anti-repressor protein